MTCGAPVTKAASSHAICVSKPGVVAAIIETAAQGVNP